MVTPLSTKYSEHPIVLLRKIVKILYTIAAKSLFCFALRLKELQNRIQYIISV